MIPFPLLEARSTVASVLSCLSAAGSIRSERTSKGYQYARADDQPAARVVRDYARSQRARKKKSAKKAEPPHASDGFLLTLPRGETDTLTLTIAEARKLYQALGDLFNP